MKMTIRNLPMVCLALLTLGIGIWTLSPASAQAGNGIVQAVQDFMKEARMQASDHNKLTDCVTEGQ